MFHPLPSPPLWFNLNDTKVLFKKKYPVVYRQKTCRYIIAFINIFLLHIFVFYRRGKTNICIENMNIYIQLHTINKIHETRETTFWEYGDENRKVLVTYSKNIVFFEGWEYNCRYKNKIYWAGKSKVEWIYTSFYSVLFSHWSLVGFLPLTNGH